MTQDFTSVTLFYVAVRNVLLSDAGMTVERSLGTHDLILTGAGAFVRLRMVVVSPTVSAVCLTPGTDPDVLAVSTDDPERCFPFNTAAPNRISASIEWVAGESLLQFLLAPNADPPAAGILRCYRGVFALNPPRVFVSHEDPPSMQYAPNFKDSGGPYLEVGA